MPDAAVPSLENPTANQVPERKIVSQFYRTISAVLEILVVALISSSAAISVVQVFFRYVLNNSLSWPEEVAQWAFVWAVFLGLGLLTGRKGHISIRLVSNFLSGRLAIAHTYLVNIIIAATSVMMILNGMDFVGRVMQFSPAMMWPLKWLFIAVPVGAVINLIYLARTRETFWFDGLLSIAAGIALYYFVLAFAPALFGQNNIVLVLMIGGLSMILLEVPIVFALAFGTFLSFAPKGDLMLVVISQHMSASLNSFTLLAIPFFIAAAAVMNAGGISARLVDVATHLVGHFRGGLGQANIATNVMLAGVSGSSTADASAIAKALVPEMEKQGYPRAFSCALTSASSTLANLIPPGLGLIIYAALASVSVGALFIGTIIPGLLAASALAVVVYFVARKNGYDAGRTRSSGKEQLKAFGYAIPALMLPVLIVGGVRFGVFTATEAGSMALVFAILCGAFIYRKLTIGTFVGAMREASFDTIAVAVVIAAAAPFAWVLAFEQMPQKIAAALGMISDNPVLLLIMVNLFLIVVGLFMEMIAAMVILVPILVPLVVAVGVDPLHFGIILVFNLVLGALTPPLGVLVFTTARVGKADPLEVFRAILPFIFALLIVLALVTYVPQLTLIPIQFLGP